MYNINMNNKVPDIYAIQNYPEELSYALDHITTDDVVVFENASTKLRVGNKTIKDRLFDIVIFSENSDIMILVDKYSQISKEEVFNKLKERDIDYHLVSFLSHKTQSYNQNTPELWFARNIKVFKSACEDTKSKTDDLTYVFKRNVESELNFEFLTNSLNVTTFAGKIVFSGFVKFADKTVLITISNNTKGKYEKIEEILNSYGFTETNGRTI